MRFLIRPLLAIMILLFAVPVFAGNVIGGPGFYGGHEYYVVLNGHNMWQEVEDFAVQLGGHLVAINDADEEAFIVDFILDELPGQNGGYWIGLYRQSSANPWQWVGGDPITYSKGIGGPGGDCVQLIAIDASWQRWPCTSDFIGDGRVGVVEVDPVPTYSCLGFEPPMANYPVTAKKNRALPLKAEIFDAEGLPVFGSDLIAPPILQVWQEYDTPEADDVSADALPAGQGTEGNQFVFTDGLKWQFNLKTSNYSGPGTYTAIMESGDPSEYVIDPSCLTEFVIK